LSNRIVLLWAGVALLAIAWGSALTWNLVRFRDSLNAVEHTNDVLRQISETEIALLRAESAERGWVLSGDPSYLQAYHSAANEAARSLQAIESLAADDATQLRQLTELRALIAARLAALARVIDLGPAQREEALKIVESERVQQSMARIRAALEDMQRTEESLLNERRLQTDREVVRTTAFAAAMAFLAMVGASFGAYLLQRRRTIRELRSAKGYLEAILAAAPDAMIAYDESGLIDSFSATAEQMFKMGSEEAQGRRITSLFLDSADPAAFLASTADSPGTIREVQGRRKDGSIFAADLHVRRMQLDGSARYVAFLRDLTERQARERQAEALRDDLLHVSRLVTMGEMASALAHELNQPLTALAAYLHGAGQLLSEVEGEQSKDARDALGLAAAQAIRAGDVIRRLREFVARGEIEKGIESLKAMVQEAFALATIAHREDKARLTLALDPAVDLVLVNRIQIQQVLLNLIRNALEAMRESPRRDLIFASEPAPEGMVTITVTDSGSGIAPEAAGRLFESFMTTKINGLGLGLSISRTIVEAHGGKISAEPNPLGGMIVRFTLRSGRL
jgi:two-component system sensor kinase FixL